MAHATLLAFSSGTHAKHTFAAPRAAPGRARENVTQDVAEDVPQDAAQDVAFGGTGGAEGPPRHATTAAAAVLLCAARTEILAQLGSSVAFGSGCGEALIRVPRKAPLCS